ncbi:MAG: hypothetical protein QM734_15050 [Cyclobacteriaceae bacterium]
MKLSILLIFTVLSSFRSFTWSDELQCTSIEAIALTTDSTLGKSNGEIKIDAKGGKGKLRYLL